METNLKKEYFGSLQIVRGIAALFVFLNHAKAKKDFFLHIPRLRFEIVFGNLGVIGLTIFFCLSGFLITLLLLKEKESTKKINLNAFLKRRSLRILPLYFLIILIGQFLLPLLMDCSFEGGNIFEHFGAKALMLILVMPNYVFIIFKPHQPFIDVTWSIGVEEQFYLAWPFVVEIRKKLVPICLLLLSIQLFSELFSYLLLPIKESNLHYYYLNKMVVMIGMTKAGYFGLGALGALVYFKKLFYGNKYLNILIRLSPILFFGVLVICMFFIFPLQWISLAVCYCLFQVFLVVYYPSPKSTYLNRGLEWLGKISYSLYMFHCIVIVLLYKFYETLQLTIKVNTLGLVIILYLIVFGSTVLVSSLSFKYIESYFIKKVQNEK